MTNELDLISQLYCVFITIQPPNGTLESNCDQFVTYNGEVCSNELQYWQQCFSQQAVTDIYIPSDIDLQQTESTANTFFSALQLFSPRPECVTNLRPFLCLYLFGSCDSNNRFHQVTQTDCERLRDDVCSQEWVKAERYLPQCGDFPSQKEESCPSKLNYDPGKGVPEMGG